MVWGCVLAGLAGVLLVLVAVAGFGKVKKAKEDVAPDGTTGGNALNIIRAVFLLSFAFGLIVPWTTADRARQNTYAEAQALVEAYWHANSLPAADAAATHAALRDYTTFVVGTEWPVLSSGHISQQGWNELDTLRGHLMSQHYPDKATADANTAVLNQISTVYAARRQRAVDAAAGLPGVVSAFAVVSGAIVVFFPFLVGVRPRGRAVVPLAITAALVGAGLYVVVQDNHVFSGGVAVKPDAFRSALLEMQRIS